MDKENIRNHYKRATKAGVFFNAKAANKAIRFIENFCHHSKGRNDLIKLELWQKAIVSVILAYRTQKKYVFP